MGFSGRLASFILAQYRDILILAEFFSSLISDLNVSMLCAIYLTRLFVPPDVKVVVQPVVVNPGHHVVDEGFHRSMDLGCVARFHRLVSEVPSIHFRFQ